jgi:hypothetical protein
MTPIPGMPKIRTDLLLVLPLVQGVLLLVGCQEGPAERAGDSGETSRHV